jgi:tRNA U34 5-carboxymethylaminomethyl modifying enzyme MnmG/GidA
MTTSRAEFRLHLRYNNAPARLMGKGFRLGLVDRHQWQQEKDRELKIQVEVAALKSRMVAPTRRNLELLAAVSRDPIRKPVSLAELLARPEIRYDDLERFGHVRRVGRELLPDVCERARELLELFAPANLGQAGRVEGVSSEEVTRLLGRVRQGAADAVGAGNADAVDEVVA